MQWQMLSHVRQATRLLVAVPAIRIDVGTAAVAISTAAVAISTAAVTISIAAVAISTAAVAISTAFCLSITAAISTSPAFPALFTPRLWSQSRASACHDHFPRAQA